MAGDIGYTFPAKGDAECPVSCGGHIIRRLAEVNELKT